VALTDSVEEIVETSNNPLLGKHESWGRVKLGEIAKVQNGFAFKSELFTKEKRGMPLIRIRDVGADNTDTYYTGEYPEEYIVRTGDLLIGMDGDFNSARWRGPDALLNQRVCRIIPTSNAYEPRLLDHALPGYLKAINEVTSSVTVKHLSSRTIAEIPLPLPPLQQQRRIAQAIELQLGRLDAAVARLHAAKAKLKRYKQSVLKAAVEGALTEEWREKNAKVEGGAALLQRVVKLREEAWGRLKARGSKKYERPSAYDGEASYEVPATWAWARWEQVGFSQNGRAFPSKDYTTQGTKLLRPGNLFADGSVRWSDGNTRCMPNSWAEEYPDFIVGSNELVMNLTAQSLADEFLGRICMTGDGERCLLNQRIARITPVGVDTRFVMWVMKAWYFRRFVDELNTGSLIQHMFTSQLADFVMPIPPLDEQVEIVRQIGIKMTAVEETERATDQSLADVTRLRQAVLKRAFEGRLV
jgi:type I restriction enzyme S subunit